MIFENTEKWISKNATRFSSVKHNQLPRASYYTIMWSLFTILGTKLAIIGWFSLSNGFSEIGKTYEYGSLRAEWIYTAYSVLLDCRLRHLPLSTNRLVVLQEQHTGVEKYPIYSFQFFHAPYLFWWFQLKFNFMPQWFDADNKTMLRS